MLHAIFTSSQVLQGASVLGILTNLELRFLIIDLRHKDEMACRSSGGLARGEATKKHFTFTYFDWL